MKRDINKEKFVINTAEGLDIIHRKRMKKMIKLEEPTLEFVNKFLSNSDFEENYKLTDSSIAKLIAKFPENKKFEDVLLKVTVINSLYSTNIFDVIKIAKHIYNLNIDNEIREGKPSAVHEIAVGHGIKSKRFNKELNLYSFATKYCSWHNLNEYVIYDSYVEKVLLAYRKMDKKITFKNDDLRNFETFKKVVLDFREQYGLSKYSLKEIDKFLWAYGKSKFANY